MKKCLSILFVIMLLICLLPLTAHALEDPGFVDTEFVSSVNHLMNENWDDHYFCGISLIIGDDKMWIDGEEQSISPAVFEEGSLLLPIIDLAGAVGDDVNIDKGTGQITVGDDHTVVIEPVGEEVSDRRKHEKKYKVRDFTVNDDGTVEGRYTDGTKFIRKPLVTARTAEKSLNIEVYYEKNNVIITRPYQLKQLIVQTRNKGTLPDTFGASASVTDRAGLYLLQYGSAKAAKYAFERFDENENIEFVTPNQIVKTESLSWGTDRIAADLIKTKLVFENKIKKNLEVAVIDTGVDAAHPFLSGRISNLGYDFLDNDRVPEDTSGHGTHITGTIVDCSTSNVKIMPVKVLDKDGYGNLLTVSLGIKYAANSGAKVINMSFGAYDKNPSNLIAQGVNYATDKGCICVAAAGNESRDVIDICPAGLTNTIAVSAIDSSDLPAEFSNYGNAIDVAAPGVDITSCVPRGQYASLSGTSTAAPHVTASVAMLLLDQGTLSPDGAKAALQSITKAAGPRTVYGMGIVDFRHYLESNGTVISEEYTELPFINGYSGGIFKPDTSISRAETVQILYNILAPGVKDKLSALSGFRDIDASHWAANAFGWAVSQDYLKGSGSGLLRPADSITRAELSAVLHRVAQKENLHGETAVTNADFNDIKEHWAYDDILALARKGITMGYGDGSFKPENRVTRAETVVMITRLFSRSNEYRPNISFSDVPHTHWAYDYIMNAVNGCSLLLFADSTA